MKISQRYLMKRGYVKTHVNLYGISYDFNKNLQYISIVAVVYL